MRKLKKQLLTLSMIFLLFIPACTINQKVAYSLRQVETAEITPFYSNGLFIRMLRDAREPLDGELIKYRTSKSILVKKKYGSLIRINGEDWWFNSDEFYKSDSLNHAITDMIGRHINESKMFSNVTIIRHESLEDIQQDYIIDGVIKKFEGLIERNEEAEAISGGFFGTIAASMIKAKYKGTTALELKLIEGASGEIIWEGLICGVLEGEASASTTEYGGYFYANESLKKAVNNFIEEVRLFGEAEWNSPDKPDGK